MWRFVKYYCFFLLGRKKDRDKSVVIVWGKNNPGIENTRRLVYGFWSALVGHSSSSSSSTIQKRRRWWWWWWWRQFIQFRIMVRQLYEDDDDAWRVPSINRLEWVRLGTRCSTRRLTCTFIFLNSSMDDIFSDRRSFCDVVVVVVVVCSGLARSFVCSSFFFGGITKRKLGNVLSFYI